MDSNGEQWRVPPSIFVKSQQALFFLKRCAFRQADRILISPIIDTAYKIQIAKGKDVLEDVATSSSGCWNSFLYVNGRSDEMHTKMNCAYTFITVPNQRMDINAQLNHKPVFLFKLNSSSSNKITVLSFQVAG